jgi:hypothetical protein
MPEEKPGTLPGRGMPEGNPDTLPGGGMSEEVKSALKINCKSKKTC